MLRRVPPVVLAAVATAVVAAVVVAVVLLTGNAAGRQIAPCTDALDAGSYGCVVFVSIEGSVGGESAAAPSGGAITYRVERRSGRERLIWSGDCGGGAADVVVTAARYRLSAATPGPRTCQDDGPVDAWAARLLTGTVQVDDRDDGTVELAHGAYRARFAQVVAAR